MKVMSFDCDPARLKRLLDNGLGPAEEAATIRHLDVCASCQKAIESMAAGSGLWGVARDLDDLWHPDREAPTPGQPDLGPHAGPGSCDDRVLDLLEPSERPGVLGRLGSHEVVRVLGRGGMGVVFQAFDPALNRPVAIKVLAPELSTSGMARRRFAREAQATAAIVHDHVIAIHAVEANARLPYLVMQYIPGSSLQDRIDRAGPLELTEVLRIGMQVASGLAAAHAQGVIHRDIKPANILLENGVERVKITDFGLARALDDASLTQSGVVTGTPQYMAPEQARGELVDHRADLFSLGTLIYAMCTGRSPFRAGSTLAVLRRVVEEDPRPIREVNPDIPRWLETIVSRLHAKDPARRYETAAEVAELLAQCLAHVQQPDAAPLPIDRKEPATRRRRTSAAAALVVALAGLGASEATGVTQLADAVVSVLRIKTDEGTLLVEIVDPEVKVSVDDRDLVIHGAGLQEVRLSPGVHRLRTRQPGGPDRAELIEITRGGSRVARVTREWEPSKVLDPGALESGKDVKPSMPAPLPGAASSSAMPAEAFPILVENGLIQLITFQDFLAFQAHKKQLDLAKAKLEQIERTTRNVADPALVNAKRKVNELTEELRRRWPAHAQIQDLGGQIMMEDAFLQWSRYQDFLAFRELNKRLEDAKAKLDQLKRVTRNQSDLVLLKARKEVDELTDELRKRWPAHTRFQDLAGSQERPRAGMDKRTQDRRRQREQQQAEFRSAMKEFERLLKGEAPSPAPGSAKPPEPEDPPVEGRPGAAPGGRGARVLPGRFPLDGPSVFGFSIGVRY